MEPPEDPAPDPVTLRDALCALTAMNQDVALLNYGNIIVQRGYHNLSIVRLLGGGVGGKDMSQAIFVGKGMLTAAILGDEVVPSSRQILRTIKELNEGENCGVFVIAQANADLFNFGLAVERANADCRTRVKLLAIDDDRSAKKERYACGYILLTKIMGAMAEEGVLFDDMYQFYKAYVLNQIATVPLQYAEEKGPRHKKSITLHEDFDSSVRHVIDTISQENLSLHPSIPLVGLINTSKTLERLSELGLVKQVIERLRQLGVCLVRIYCGNFVSQIHGTASLTIMKLMDDRIVKYLDATSQAPGWQKVTQFLPEITLHNEIPGVLKHQGKQHVELKGPRLGESQSIILVKALQFACEALISCERQLNTIDAEKSDGNVGTRFKHMAENVNKRLREKRLPVSCPYAFFKKMGIIAESAMGGTMGSIYGVLFESAAGVFGAMPDGEIVTPFMWARVLSVAVKAIKQYCTREVAEHSMFYPLKCAEMAINREIAKNFSSLQCYGVGVSMAEEMAQTTKLPHCKYSDAGAHAVGIWMRAVFEGVKLMSAPDACEGDNL